MDYIEKDAVISGEHQEYRYSLRRIWDKEKEIITFVLMNPSTADAMEDDMTVKKCVKLASFNGFGGIEIVNLYSFRATKPESLIGQGKKYLIGDDCDSYILNSARNRKVVLGWGNIAKELKEVKKYKRDEEVAEMLQNKDNELHCLALTAKGCPKHPLFIPNETKFIRISWNGNEFSKAE
jgi:hypothetical protein